jgi:hypothetical protein
LKNWVIYPCKNHLPFFSHHTPHFCPVQAHEIPLQATVKLKLLHVPLRACLTVGDKLTGPPKKERQELSISVDCVQRHTKLGFVLAAQE